MASDDRCLNCRGTHDGPLGYARCAYEAETIATLIAHAARLDRPASETQVRDLWAHAREQRDVAGAARWVQIVLDLGWRPVIGATKETR